MEYVLESIRGDWQSFLRFGPRFIYGFLLLLVFLLAARFGGRLVANILERSAQFRSNAHFLQNLVTWAIAAIGILLSLGLMGFTGIATSLLATGGVVAIVLGFAFREIGENFLAGFFLTFSRPFEIDDLIKTGDLKGNVRSIELRYVHIRTFDACDVFVPSAQIFREPLYNYTRDGLRRPSFTVGVAYHDDPALAITLLEQAVRDTDGVLAEPQPYITVKEFAAQYIEYEVFFFLDLNLGKRGYNEISNEVMVNCWRALRDTGMTFSTDVTSGFEIISAPDLKVEMVTAQPRTEGA
jgi:small-conductance mechanosensitive channel